MEFFQENIESASAMLTVAASVTATAILCRDIFNHLFHPSFRTFFYKSLSSRTTVVIEEFEGLTANQMFDAVNSYLGTKLASLSIRRIKVNKPEKEMELAVTLDTNQDFVDTFQDLKLNWILVCKPDYSSGSVRRYFELSFNKKNRDMVLSFYLPYILQTAKAIRMEKNKVKLYTIDYNFTDYWSSVNLDHPARFDTMAMNEKNKKLLMEDLARFLGRRDYYRRVGKAWKRGYLFYGPPGTGKSSLVAAMANYLKFDIYDLDLREVKTNSELRSLLSSTVNRSILLIEDFDTSVELYDEDLEGQYSLSPDDSRVTLSAVLNIIDGLWSSCGDERIIVITSNRKYTLDPALLRPGRLDLQLEMSNCTFDGFKTLAKNYLNIESHALFHDIEELLNGTEVRPAEVAGELMKHDTAELALNGLIYILIKKKLGQKLDVE